MTFDSSTTFAEGSHEQVAFQTARKLVDQRGTTSRKHFLDSYAEHLDALKRAQAPR
jgi:hypothetical protein